MMRPSNSRPDRARAARRGDGFTLLEMAVVLFIVGMLTAGLIGPVQTQLEARDRHATRDYLGQAVEALYGFAITQRRLPCPDTDGDGRANPPYSVPVDGQCDADVGFLPWAELGVEPADAWGNRVTYRVRQPEFTVPAQNSACDGDTANEFDLCARGNIDIETRGDNTATAGAEAKFLYPAASAENVVAVLVSHGRNGYGAVRADGANGITPTPVPSADRDEQENADGDAVFVSRGYTRGDNGCADDTDEGSSLCEFDDLVLPVSRALLMGRMVQAGQLP